MYNQWLPITPYGHHCVVTNSSTLNINKNKREPTLQARSKFGLWYTSRHQDIKTSRHQDIKTSRHQDIKTSRSFSTFLPSMDSLLHRHIPTLLRKEPDITTYLIIVVAWYNMPKTIIKRHLWISILLGL